MKESDTNSDSSTNFLPFVDVDHTSEADLVREKIKDGSEDESKAPTSEQTKSQKPFINDPVLAKQYAENWLAHQAHSEPFERSDLGSGQGRQRRRE